MLLRETVAVCCETHTEHTDTRRGYNTLKQAVNTTTTVL
jgi:hypothetical protein